MIHKTLTELDGRHGTACDMPATNKTRAQPWRRVTCPLCLCIYKTMILPLTSMTSERQETPYTMFRRWYERVRRRAFHPGTLYYRASGGFGKRVLIEHSDYSSCPKWGVGIPGRVAERGKI